MISNRLDLLNQLFEKWGKERPEYKILCKDGVLVDEEWDKEKPKIMFLLKETYTDFWEIKGPHGPKGTSGTFWRRMRMWTYIISEIYNNKNPVFHDAMKIKEEPNRTIAYLNIKKNVERVVDKNDAYSNNEDIRKYAEKDKDFLNQQIEIIAPNIILCCGTFRFCSDIFIDINKISDNLYKTKNVWLIDFEHPSQRKSYQINFDNLTKILSKINWDQSCNHIK